MKIQNLGTYNFYYNKGENVIAPEEIVELEETLAQSLLDISAGVLVIIKEEVPAKEEKVEEAPAEIPAVDPEPIIPAVEPEIIPAVEPAAEEAPAKKGKK